jgi:acetolactate synthase-1/2/3 large subunit
MYSVSESIARALAPHVGEVFGLMGNGNAYFVDALERLGHPMVPVRHEVAAVASADAYRRVSGRLAAATTTYGPGFTNVLTALADAAQAGIPLILVAGDRPESGPRPWDVDQAGAAEALGVATVTVSRRDAASAAIRAVERALRDSRPVVLAIPYDIAALPVEPEGASAPDLRPAPESPRPEIEEVERAAGALAAAERPLILAGRGAIGASEEVRRLASGLRASVATTAPAQGLFHVKPGEVAGYTDLGVCGGFAAEEAAARIRAADVVLAVGAGLNQFTLAFGRAFATDARVIQADLAETPAHSLVTDYLRGDAREIVMTLEALLEDAGRLPAWNGGGDPVLRSGALDGSTADPAAGSSLGADPLARPRGEEFAPDGRLDPRRVMHRLNEMLPEDRVVVTDGGHFIQWPVTYLGVERPESMVLVGTQFQSIGLGFPSAPGAARAAGERLTVLVTGDGGGLMGIADAETFVRTARRGVVVVMNDAAYGAEVHQYGARGLAEEPMMLPDLDFAGLLSAAGARARVVERLEDLRDLEEWLAAGEPGTYAVDCRISREVIAPHFLEVRAQTR